jgi:hypothetical protein
MYGEVWPRVSDSGRVFLLHVGKANTETKRNADSAMIEVFGVEPLETGGISLLPADPNFSVGKYASNGEVLRGIMWDKMRIVSRGKQTRRQFMGIDLPLWSVEEFWIPQAKGAPIHQAIVNGNYAPSMFKDGKPVLTIPSG